jgi:hypothetical protein
LDLARPAMLSTGQNENYVTGTITGRGEKWEGTERERERERERKRNKLFGFGWCLFLRGRTDKNKLFRSIECTERDSTNLM